MGGLGRDRDDLVDRPLIAVLVPQPHRCRQILDADHDAQDAQEAPALDGSWAGRSSSTIWCWSPRSTRWVSLRGTSGACPNRCFRNTDRCTPARPCPTWSPPLKPLDPVCRHPTGGPGSRLIIGMRMWWRQHRTVARVVYSVIPEPVFARLERLDDRMARPFPVFGRVAHQRIVAATHVPTRCTPSQVHPPAVGGVALHAPGSTR